jgi:uncharacterized Zn finger protein
VSAAPLEDPRAPTVVHPAAPARKAAPRASTWWGKAWVRAVEEVAYSQTDLATARSVSRSGRIGQISVRPGQFVAAVEDADGLWAVLGSIPVLAPAAVATLVEAVAAEAGRLPALLAGELPITLVEHAEEAGVELLPYGAELGSSCTCDFWADPCPHALAVLYQLAWLLEADPFVLLHLRGVPRDELLAALHERTRSAAPEPGSGWADDEDPDVEVAADAALRAAALLRELAQEGPQR